MIRKLKEKIDTCEDVKEPQAHDDSTNSNNQDMWTNEGRTFQRNIRKQQMSEDLSVKTNNNNRYEVQKTQKDNVILQKIRLIN